LVSPVFARKIIFLILPTTASIFRIPEEVFNDPKRFSCQSDILASITNRGIRSHGNRKHLTESSEENEDIMSSSMNSKPDSRQLQWNFRRRESSDRSSQPHSAPTGIAAQQSENFQRFYRAVVSPTHVRVTAGGRIVPNTRATVVAPPQFDWDDDKFNQERNKSASEHGMNSAQLTSWLPGTMIPIGHPAVATNTFAPHYNIVSQCNPFHSMAPQTRAVISGQHGNGSDTRFPSANTNGESVSVTVHSETLSHPIKISPPSQFDQSKPYMYNGQVIYPVSQAFQPLPPVMPVGMNILGNTGLLPQAQLHNGSTFLPAQFPGTMASSIPPQMMFAPQQVPMIIPTIFPSESMAQMMSHGSIRGNSPHPDALKSQIHNLRHQVKFCNHQLDNNKHQIDIHAMETQRAILEGQIKNLDLMLELQAGQETGIAARSQNTEVTSAPHVATAAPPVAYSTKHVGVKKVDPTNRTLLKGSSGNGTVVQSTASRKGSGGTKSRLSIKAPAFQPRSQTLVLPSQAHQFVNSINETDGLDPTNFETQAQIEARLLSRSTTDWGNSNSSNIRTGPAVLSRTQSNHEIVLYDPVSNQTPTVQRSHTFHDQGISTSSAALMTSKHAVPYLVGTLPHGIHASLAKSTDFLYSRPLTDEEVRARHLYWGKAPRSVQSGLPKFDGKDFYPPSPVKKIGRLSTTHHSISSDADPADNSLITLTSEDTSQERNAPCYNTPSPLHPLYAAQARNMIPMPQPVFFAGPSGNTMVLPQFTTFTDSGINALGQAADEEKSAEYPYLPLTPPDRDASIKGVVSDGPPKLFTKPGMPGTQTPPIPSQDHEKSKNNIKAVAALTNIDSAEKVPSRDDDDDDTLSVNSWRLSGIVHQRVDCQANMIASPNSMAKDAQSTSSSVEIHLSPQTKNLSPKSAHEKAFVERVENFRR
jgi:hypothetical protein